MEPVAVPCKRCGHLAFLHIPEGKNRFNLRCVHIGTLGFTDCSCSGYKARHLDKPLIDSNKPITESWFGVDMAIRRLHGDS